MLQTEQIHKSVLTDSPSSQWKNISVRRYVQDSAESHPTVCMM